MGIRTRVEYLPHYQKKWGLLSYKNADDSGFDLRAAVFKTTVLKAHAVLLVPCGIKIEMIADQNDIFSYELQIRARSGLAAKFGIGVANGPGTVDYGYRGEIKVPLINFSDTDFIIEPGDRIAQGVICPVIQTIFEETDKVLENTTRGAGGFGSTGQK